MFMFRALNPVAPHITRGGSGAVGITNSVPQNLWPLTVHSKQDSLR